MQRLVNVRFAPKADIRKRIEHVCFVLEADGANRSDCRTTQCQVRADERVPTVSLLLTPNLAALPACRPSVPSHLHNLI